MILVFVLFNTSRWLTICPEILLCLQLLQPYITIKTKHKLPLTPYTLEFQPLLSQRISSEGFITTPEPSLFTHTLIHTYHFNNTMIIF